MRLLCKYIGIICECQEIFAGLRAERRLMHAVSSPPEGLAIGDALRILPFGSGDHWRSKYADGSGVPKATISLIRVF